MTEDEQLGIADETPATEAAEPAPEATTEDGGKSTLSREEIMAMCVRYEKARTPWADDAEAQQVATANLSGDDAQEYLAEVMEWHKAGEPQIEEAEAEEVEEKEKGGKKEMTEEEMLGIAD